MSNYFRRLPNLDYPSLLKTRKSNLDFVQTKNLFRRAKIREDLFADFMQFDKYKIVGDERPDNVALNVYGNDSYDWVILMANVFKIPPARFVRIVIADVLCDFFP